MVEILPFREKETQTTSSEEISDEVSMEVNGQLISFQTYKDSRKISKPKSETKTTSPGFTHRTDRNLVNNNSLGVEYIEKILTGVYESIGAGADRCTDVDFILRVEYQVKSCSIADCRRLLKLADHYLATPTMSDSLERPFMMHVRNKVFEKFESFPGLEIAQRKHVNTNSLKKERTPNTTTPIPLPLSTDIQYTDDRIVSYNLAHEMRASVSTEAVVCYFQSMVEYTLLVPITNTGIEYFEELFRVMAYAPMYKNTEDVFLLPEHTLQSIHIQADTLSIFECKRLMHEIDTKIRSITLSRGMISSYNHIRSFIFSRYTELKKK